MKEIKRKCFKCGSSPADDPEITLFRFPKPGSTNIDRCELWAMYCCPDKSWSNNEFQMKLHTEHRMLCHLHFKKTAFVDFSKKKLRRFASPDVEADVDGNAAGRRRPRKTSTDLIGAVLQKGQVCSAVARDDILRESKMTRGFSRQAEGQVLNFDHLVFYVANAKTASNYFVTRLGFRPLAIRAPTESRPVLAIAVRLNQITIIFESPTTPEGDITKDIIAHGDFVKDVAFEVQNLDELVRKAKEGGAEIVKDITVEEDKLGVVRYAVLRTYGDNTHTLIDRSKYKGTLLPGYELLEDDILNKLLPPTHLMYIDHVEGNMADGTLEDSWTWYEKNLNMHRFWCVDYKHDVSQWSCIKSASVINRDENVLLSMNEATKGLGPTSKATEFVKALGTSGVEHIALYTDDIVTTMLNFKARGADILGVPPTYYDLIREKLKLSSVKVAETIEALKEGCILIDFDERGYMLQGFIKHLQARPTLFIEIIQRRNHRGFGAMNYKWVFEAIELLDKQAQKADTEDAKKNDAA